MVKVPILQTRDPRQADITGVGGGSGDAYAASTVAQELENLRGKVNQVLDRTVINEGTKAGTVAGMDPAFRPKDDITLRGQAFNRAATQSALSRLDTDVRVKTADLYEQYKDDPGALSQAYKKLKGDYDAEVFNEIRPDFERTFALQTKSFLQASGRLNEARVADAARADVSNQVDQRLTDIERLSFTLSGDQTSDAEIAGELQGLETLMISNGPKGEFSWKGKVIAADPARTGAFTADQIERTLQNAKTVVRENKVLGEFNRLDSLSEKLAFRDELLKDFGSSDHGLSRRETENLASRMNTEISRLSAQNSGRVSMLRSQVRQVSDHLTKGYGLPESQLNALENEIAGIGDQDLLANIQEARSLYSFSQGIKILPPSALQSMISAGRKNIADKGGNAGFQEAARIELAEKMLSEMNTELGRDPVSWANRVGLVDAGTLQLGSDEAIPMMQHRVEVARSIADHYGISAKFLTAEEKTELTDIIDHASTDEKLAMINRIEQGFGGDAPEIFSEISNDDAIFAHAGGLSVYGYDQAQSAREILSGQAAIKEGQNYLPAKADLELSVQDVTGRALSRLPAVKSSVVSAAKAIYTARAIREGIAPDDFDDDLWRDAMNAAVGGDGVSGGFGDYNGTEIVLPVGTSEDQFNNLLGDITDEDLIKAGEGGYGPHHANGDPLTAEEFKDARLLNIGDGKYIVDLSDNESRLIQGGEDGGFYIFDFARIRGALISRYMPIDRGHYTERTLKRGTLQ